MNWRALPPLLVALAACGCTKPPAEYDRPEDSDVMSLDYRTPLLKELRKEVPGGPRDWQNLDGGVEVDPRANEPGVFTMSRRVTVLVRECPREAVLEAADRYLRGLGVTLRDVGCKVRGPTGSNADGESQFGYDYSLGDRTGVVTVRVGSVPGESPFQHIVTVDVVERAPGTPREPAK